jgi:hypothetical protein
MIYLEIINNKKKSIDVQKVGLHIHNSPDEIEFKMRVFDKIQQRIDRKIY